MSKKKREKSRIKKLFFTLLTMIASGIIYSLGVASFENFKVNQAIKEFKNRAVYQETVYREIRSSSDPIIQETKIYFVPRETSAELVDQRNVEISSDYLRIGSKGDIFVTPQSPFPHIFGFHQFMSFYFGGHAAINDGNGNHLEASGYPNSDESLWDIITDSGENNNNYSVTAHKNTYPYMLSAYNNELDPEYKAYGYNYRTKMVGLRVKNVTSDQIDQVVDFAESKTDKSLYNFLFFLNPQFKYYCTDFVSRAYQSAMIPNSEDKHYSRVLNDDGFITSVSDLILSKDTYIHYYIEVINGVMHIYYLEDVV